MILQARGKRSMAPETPKRHMEIPDRRGQAASKVPTVREAQRRDGGMMTSEDRGGGGFIRMICHCYHWGNDEKLRSIYYSDGLAQPPDGAGNVDILF